MTKLPAWARWNEAAADTPWTVGIEEEVMLLDRAEPGLWRTASMPCLGRDARLRRRAPNRSAPDRRGRRSGACAPALRARRSVARHARTARGHCWHTSNRDPLRCRPVRGRAVSAYRRHDGSPGATRTDDGPARPCRGSGPGLGSTGAQRSADRASAAPRPVGQLTVLARGGFQFRLDTHADLLDV